MKRCPDCGETKPWSEFPRNRSTSSGYGSYCKLRHNRRWREGITRNGGSRDYHLRHRYGIGRAEVDAMIRAQGGLCAACKRRQAAHVDHGHRTGRVRGILCLPRNTALGKFRDDPAIIRRAIGYLRVNR